MNQRADDGRFLPGWAGGPGRPRREIEMQYLRKIQDGVSLQVWQGICDKAIAQALAGDSTARAWLSRYLLPKDLDLAKDQNDSRQRREMLLNIADKLGIRLEVDESSVPVEIETG